VSGRTIIAALLAGVPDCEFNAGESIITQSILDYLGKIPYVCLLYGKTYPYATRHLTLEVQLNAFSLRLSGLSAWFSSSHAYAYAKC